MKISNYVTTRPKKLKDAIFPIFVVNWLSGLNIVEFPIGYPRPFLSVIYVLIMMILYYYNTFMGGIYSLDSSNMPTSSAIILNIFWFYNAFFGLVAIILSWHNQKALKLCIERIELLNTALEYLGISNNHGTFFLHLILTLIITLIGIIVLMIFDFFWDVKNENLKQVFYSICLNEPTIILQIIIELNFGTIITILGYSFKNINVLLEQGLSDDSEQEKSSLNQKNLKKITLVLPAQFNFTTTDKSKNIIQVVKHLHLELSKIAWEVEKIFGFTIATSMVPTITLLIGNGLSLYNSISTPIVENVSNGISIEIMDAIAWCILYLSRVLYVNSICEKVTAEAHKADELIFCVGRTNHDMELRKEIEQFSFQLTQRPLFFSLYGLITLDYNFIAKFLGTAVTYMIIIVQMEPEHKGSVNVTTTTPTNKINMASTLSTL